MGKRQVVELAEGKTREELIKSMNDIIEEKNLEGFELQEHTINQGNKKYDNYYASLLFIRY